MNILVVVSPSYVKYCLVMLESLYRHNSESKIEVFLVSDHSLDEYKEVCMEQAEKYGNVVQFIQVDTSRFNWISFPGHVPKTALYKLLITEVVPTSLDRILVLDLDLLITKSLAPLYNQSFDGQAAIACDEVVNPLDVASRRENRHAGITGSQIRLNVGVVLYDLEQMRKLSLNEEDIKRAYLELDETCYLPDEMLFNLLFASRTKRENPFFYNLPSWASNSVESSTREKEQFGTILHYYGAVDKPWSCLVGEEQSEQYDLWWKYAESTFYYDELLKEYHGKARIGLSKRYKGLLGYFNSMVKWNYISQLEQHSVAKYLTRSGIRTVAIYGSNIMQDLLRTELELSGIKVDCLLDTYEEGRRGKHNVKTASIYNYDQVDAVIVTAFYHFEAIKKNIPDHVIVHSLDDLLEKLLPEDFYLPGI